MQAVGYAMTTKLKKTRRVMAMAMMTDKEMILGRHIPHPVLPPQPQGCGHPSDGPGKGMTCLSRKKRLTILARDRETRGVAACWLRLRERERENVYTYMPQLTGRLRSTETAGLSHGGLHTYRSVVQLGLQVLLVTPIKIH
ncbi:hypothetical protein PISMIDRAFT_201275 [Pisolithus microcarpus 441]|uniref:Uncharacterized protein n=1 Tax=Pisolithus microcarpus 441 TaxID=765257 RepID=A0A0C9ZD15_9AGAM|nr:hypothetical protein BKA83DRAFT_201275 [Pisolithus microcarpus]KIK27186.1 hypothetical protein PISMIDRAFT_201275 [Pisolithus microcarpus 441]